MWTKQVGCMVVAMCTALVVPASSANAINSEIDVNKLRINSGSLRVAGGGQIIKETELAEPYHTLKVNWGIQWHLSGVEFLDSVVYDVFMEFYMPAAYKKENPAILVNLYSLSGKKNEPLGFGAIKSADYAADQWHTAKIASRPLSGFNGYFYLISSPLPTASTMEQLRVRKFWAVPAAKNDEALIEAAYNAKVRAEKKEDNVIPTAGKNQEAVALKKLKSEELAELKNLEAKGFLVAGGKFVKVSDTGTELAKPWGIQWHLNPDWFKEEGVQYKAVFEYFIPETLNSNVTALTLGLWRTKPKAQRAATGFKLDLTKVKRGEWQTAEMENLPDLSGFSGYFYFEANSKDAYDSAEKIKIKSIKLAPK